MSKHPPKLEACVHCRTLVTRAAIFANDPNGPSGWFHLECYSAAKMGHASVDTKLLHADLESTVGAEYRALELVAP